MPNSIEIVQMAQRFRRALIANERDAIARMSEAYKTAWEQIRRELNTLTAQIASAQARGEKVNRAWLFQQQRLTLLQSQIEYQINTFAQSAGVVIEYQQRMAINAALENAASLVSATTDAAITLARLPTAQVAELVGMMGNGSPLSGILNELAKAGSTGIRETLIKGVALGWNPRKMERMARQALGKVLTRALTVARTESMRAYREATYQTYNANTDIIDGWYWISAADSRTCASCWAMHGTKHRLNERLDDHPNGRCTPVPSVRNYPLTIETGAERFAKLDKGKQREVLGNAAFDAFEDGKIGLNDMVHRHRSNTWGTHRRQASLKEALAGK